MIVKTVSEKKLAEVEPSVHSRISVPKIRESAIMKDEALLEPKKKKKKKKKELTTPESDSYKKLCWSSSEEEILEIKEKESVVLKDILTLKPTNTLNIDENIVSC